MEPVSIAEGFIASIKIISATIEKLKASKRIKEEEKGYLDNIKSESENLKRQILSLSDKSFMLLGYKELHEKIDAILIQSTTLMNYIDDTLKAKDDSEKRVYLGRAFTPLDVIMETCDYISSDVIKKYSFLKNEFGISKNLSTILDNITSVGKAMEDVNVGGDFRRFTSGYWEKVQKINRVAGKTISNLDNKIKNISEEIAKTSSILREGGM